MKKLILLAAVTLMGLAGFVASSNAYDRQDEPRNRTEIRERYRDRELEVRQLRAELYQLDLMFSRIDSRFGYYGSRGGHGSQLRWQYSRLLRDRERLNYELSRRPLDRLRVHSQIDRIRDELREIEVQVRVRSHRSFYR
jgi:hypothetical protein